MNLIQFPKADSISDIPQALRNLAEQIENGKFDDCHNLAWVIDCGDSRIEIGYLGSAPEASTSAHFLFSLASRKLELAVFSSNVRL